MSEFYDVVDSDGNIVETAAEQLKEGDVVVSSEALVGPEAVPLERERKQPTEGEMKKLRKQYVTIQNPKVIACGHGLSLGTQPTHRNCESCWFAFFQNHGELVQQLDEMHTTGQDKVIVDLQGSKFYSQWRKFMSTVANWKQERKSETNQS